MVTWRFPDQGRGRESCPEPEPKRRARNPYSSGHNGGLVSTEGFSPSRGGRPEAARLLVVVTDGESHDGEELPAALRACEAGSVTRYGIAVLGHYIRRQRDPSSFLREIRAIASDPDERFFFNVTDEAALTDIVDALGDRIFGLEGSHGENESSFGLEMSQIGFSTHQLKDGILFGMVGAYDWGGSVLWLKEGHRLFPPRTALEEEFPTALQNHAAYLGYSVSSLILLGGRRLFLSGAPRFKHRGKVIAFQLRKDGSMNVAQSLQGEQIGSYFGSELCPLDTDGDGVTDVLLVAAPMYLGPQYRETGRVYVYLVGQPSLILWRTLQPDPPQDSRFGFAMGALPDLNQDGFADVAVGAPLEDGHRGALYIYHGTQGGIRPRPAQRISAASMPQPLSYFGRSVDGRLDLDGDELVDVAVGAQGAAVLLSSRPIVHLAPSLTVTPPAVSVVQRDCQRHGQDAACLTADLCFQVTSRTPGRWNRRFYVRFSASLDEWTAGARAAFDGFGQRLPARRLRVSVGNTTCQQLHFHVLDASDYLRPLALVVTFELDNATKPRPVLDEDSPTSLRKLIPFSKDCGPDNECHTDLVLQVDMDIRGSRKKPFVVRGGRQKVLASATLENRKENAYNTNLSLSFSRSLHLASFTPQKDPSVKVECAATSTHGQLCSIGHPVFQTGAKVTFVLEFEFSCSSLLSQALVRLAATSNSLESNETLHDNVVQASAYVRYEPELLVSSESTLHRYEVHPYGALPEGPGPEFKTTLRVQNLGCYSISDLLISAFFPAVAYGGSYFLSLSQIIADNASCMVQNLTEPSGAPVHSEDLRHVSRLVRAPSPGEGDPETEILAGAGGPAGGRWGPCWWAVGLGEGDPETEILAGTGGPAGGQWGWGRETQKQRTWGALGALLVGGCWWALGALLVGGCWRALGALLVGSGAGGGRPRNRGPGGCWGPCWWAAAGGRWRPCWWAAAGGRWGWGREKEVPLVHGADPFLPAEWQ
ncbi:integrin alpha-10 isoform X4 [Antechinus flavipes]|uniref:integrin alpha-10 isoform X4 n=1 Tax=Antechinus flavipes TaxID=38775 RepID=UPI00223615B4|nr:integrin alpha-10 isoform X4 [Antechinus flavipes]